MLLRNIEINYQNTTSLVNDLITVTSELENEKESVKRALDELNDLENYHANKGSIVDELEFRKRKIDKDIQNTEELIQNIKDFSERVQETDERLAQKFKQDIKSYAKKNNIELVSELDKFLKKAEMTLDALGLVPGIGEVADGINGILSLLQGNWGNALISFGSMVPLAGDSLKGLKYLDEASDLLKMGDKVVDLEKSSKKLSKATKNLDILDIDFNKAINSVNERIIPGTKGVVTGGSSTKLGKNLLESMGVSRSLKWKGYQAQHIIPYEMSNHKIIKKMGMDFDNAANGIFLRVPDKNISPRSRHRGYHSIYNEVVMKQLDKIDVNSDIRKIQNEVYQLQKKLRKLQENGLPLYPSQGASIELWEKYLKK